MHREPAKSQYLASPVKFVDISILIAMISNVLCSVGLISINKQLFKYSHFEFMLILSFLHYVFTSLSCHLMIYLRIFESKDAPISGVLPVAIGSFSYLVCCWCWSSQLDLLPSDCVSFCLTLCVCVCVCVRFASLPLVFHLSLAIQDPLVRLPSWI